MPWKYFLIYSLNPILYNILWFLYHILFLCTILNCFIFQTGIKWPILLFFSEKYYLINIWLKQGLTNEILIKSAVVPIFHLKPSLFIKIFWYMYNRWPHSVSLPSNLSSPVCLTCAFSLSSYQDLFCTYCTRHCDKLFTWIILSKILEIKPIYFCPI